MEWVADMELEKGVGVYGMMYRCLEGIQGWKKFSPDYIQPVIHYCTDLDSRKANKKIFKSSPLELINQS